MKRNDLSEGKRWRGTRSWSEKANQDKYALSVRSSRLIRSARVVFVQCSVSRYVRACPRGDVLNEVRGAKSLLTVDNRTYHLGRLVFYRLVFGSPSSFLAGGYREIEVDIIILLQVSSVPSRTFLLV